MENWLRGQAFPHCFFRFFSNTFKGLGFAGDLPAKMLNLRLHFQRATYRPRVPFHQCWCGVHLYPLQGRWRSQQCYEHGRQYALRHAKTRWHS